MREINKTHTEFETKIKAATTAISGIITTGTFCKHETFTIRLIDWITILIYWLTMYTYAFISRLCIQNHFDPLYLSKRHTNLK